MEDINDGGPAYPCETTEYMGKFPPIHRLHSGMTLRDWFAGQALAGMLANAPFLDGVRTMANGREPMFIASHSYELADAMIAAREGKR